jgi:GNAT superfamily N-acetyltransferase
MTYQEGKYSTFTHNGKEYPLDPFLKRAEKLHAKSVSMAKLEWNVQTAQPDPKRVATADINYPILYTIDPKWGYVVVDGLHRLTKAYQMGKRSIMGKEIPQEWFDEIGTVSMEDSSNPSYTVGQVTREQAFEWLAQSRQQRPEPLLQDSYSPGGTGVDRVYAFAYNGDEIVGYASLLNGQRYLIDMYVPESLRGKGIGRQLIDSLLVDLVVVRKDQEDIIAFLKAVGFSLENDFVNTRVYRKYHGAKVHAY